MPCPPSSTRRPTARQPTPLWAKLNDAAPTLWRGGETYPQSQADVEKLFADGEISAFFTYGPGSVGPTVEDGVFPGTTREAVLDSGNISNVSFVAVPANAGDQAGALVLANVLQDPEVQLELYRSAGIFPAIDLDRLTPAMQQKFDEVPVFGVGAESWRAHSGRGPGAGGPPTCAGSRRTGSPGCSRDRNDPVRRCRSPGAGTGASRTAPGAGAARRRSVLRGRARARRAAEPGSRTFRGRGLLVAGGLPLGAHRPSLPRIAVDHCPCGGALDPHLHRARRRAGAAGASGRRADAR